MSKGPKRRVSRATEGVSGGTPMSGTAPGPESPQEGAQSAQEGAPKQRKRRMKPLHKIRRRVLSEWIAVRVKDRQERHARREIEKRGGVVWIPWLYMEGDLKEEPLFPGYIFVQGPQWAYLLATPGVLDIVRMGEGAAYMPLKEWRILRGLCDKEGMITLSRKKLSPGDDVRTNKGAFQELWGVYTGHGSRTSRVRILYKVFSKEYELEFDRKDVTGRTEELKRTDWKQSTKVRKNQRSIG